MSAVSGAQVLPNPLCAHSLTDEMAIARLVVLFRAVQLMLAGSGCSSPWSLAHLIVLVTVRLYLGCTTVKGAVAERSGTMRKGTQTILSHTYDPVNPIV